jgi:hypothetical protein
MREADVGSPSADTGRAISDHRISRPGLIWRRGSQSLMGNFGGSNRSSRWHWHQRRKGRCSDTVDHLLTCQQGFLGIFCAARKSEIAKRPTCAYRSLFAVPPKIFGLQLDEEVVGLNWGATTQSSNRSPLEWGTEIFDTETNSQTGPSANRRPPAETHAECEKPPFSRDKP